MKKFVDFARFLRKKSRMRIIFLLSLLLGASLPALSDPTPTPSPTPARMGPRGAQGAKGDRGEKGDRGLAGVQGPAGPTLRSVENATARGLAAPKAIGEVLIQMSDNTLWRGTATTAGAWTSIPTVGATGAAGAPGAPAALIRENAGQLDSIQAITGTMATTTDDNVIWIKVEGGWQSAEVGWASKLRSLSSVTTLSDPTTATAEDVANKINEILTATEP